MQQYSNREKRQLIEQIVTPRGKEGIKERACRNDKLFALLHVVAAVVLLTTVLTVFNFM